MSVMLGAPQIRFFRAVVFSGNSHPFWNPSAFQVESTSVKKYFRQVKEFGFELIRLRITKANANKYMWGDLFITCAFGSYDSHVIMNAKWHIVAQSISTYKRKQKRQEIQGELVSH